MAVGEQHVPSPQTASPSGFFILPSLNQPMKRLLSLAISLLILAVLYWKIELTSLVEVFQTAHPLWMVIGLGMVVPTTWFTARRLQFLMPVHHPLSFWEAHKLILAASSLNMVLPSKAGDIAKAYFMRDRGHLSGSLALSLVVFEKSLRPALVAGVVLVWPGAVSPKRCLFLAHDCRDLGGIGKRHFAAQFNAVCQPLFPTRSTVCPAKAQAEIQAVAGRLVRHARLFLARSPSTITSYQHLDGDLAIAPMANLVFLSSG